MEKTHGHNRIIKWSVAAIITYLFFRFIVPLIMPFIIAFFIAMILQPPIRILRKRTGISRKFLSAFFIILVITGVCTLVFFSCNRLLSEVGKFVVSFNENSDEYISDFFNYLDSLTKKIPFLGALGGDFSVMISDAVDNILTSSVSKIPQAVAMFVAMMPQVLLFTVILICASYYFCSDYDLIIEKIYSFLPPVYQSSAEKLRKRLTESGISYIKASFVLAFVTFVETLIGFYMLEIDYSFTLALIVAAIDFLPILGAGTLLVPWSFVVFVQGDRYTAVGLLLIFVVVTLVRRFAEPRVISQGIGLPPILTLVAMYVGFKLFGLSGLFFAPILAIVFVHMLPDEIVVKLGVVEKNKNTDENKET